MPPTVRPSRALVVCRCAVHTVALLSATVLLAAPLHAQSTGAQRSVGAAPDPGVWTSCPASGDQGPDEPTAGAAAGQARLIVRDGTMSVEVRSCTLTQVLSLVAARTGIRMAVSEAIAPERRSWRTSLQSIEATLRELLREADIFVLYAAEPDAAQRLEAVWVYPRGGTRGIEPVPLEQWASTSDLQRQLTEWSPDLRGRAIEELIARGGDTALPQVFEALTDGDASIRQRALDAALAAGLDVPLHHLQALALDDPSPEVRLRALQALEERPDSAATIEAATRDADVNVRREAQNIVRRASQAAR